MKLSSREKFMLSVLAIVLVVYLGYTFGYIRLQNHMEELKAEYSNVKEIYTSALMSVEAVEELRNSTEDRNKELNVLCQRYYNNLEQENVILGIKSFIDRNNICANSLAFAERTLDENSIKNNAIMIDSSLAANNMNLVKVSDISISYEATYNDLMNFIDDIQSFDKDISIKNLTAVASDSSNIVGSMNISFYGIDNPYSSNKTAWTDVSEYGKRHNPFDTGKTVVDVFTREEKKYDFSISVKPTSSDLPTIILQNNKNTDSVIYKESNLVENVKISFMQQDGKYFYKYSTEGSKYPENTEWQELELANNDSISIKIYSCARNSDSDTSGIKLSISNKTDKTCVIDVNEDDTSRPRVQFDTMEGVKINNEV